MPTTEQEAEKIVLVANRYLPIDKLRRLFVDLDEEVGHHSSNDSVRCSLRMFRELVEHTLSLEKHKTEVSASWYVLFWCVVVFHSVLVLGNLASFCVAPFYAPWYLAFPACFAIIWVVCSPVNCVITEWENRIRLRLGWRMINSFVGHYCLKPLYQLQGFVEQNYCVTEESPVDPSARRT